MIGDRNNIVLIKSIVNALVELNEKFVFVGGAVVSLYADCTLFQIRPTNEIDVALEIISYAERINVESRLSKIGFKAVTNSGLTCRYTIGDCSVVDIIPTNDPTSSFKSRWYTEGFTNSIR